MQGMLGEGDAGRRGWGLQHLLLVGSGSCTAALIISIALTDLLFGTFVFLQRLAAVFTCCHCGANINKQHYMLLSRPWV